MISAIQAEEMNMSIWLRSNGLSFAIYPKSTEDIPLPIKEEYIPFESALSLRENLENSIYQQPELGLPYARVTLYYTPSTVGLAPQALYDYEQREVWETTISRSRDEVIRPYRPEGEERVMILGTLTRSVVEFLERSFLMLTFCPSYIALLSKLRANCQVEGGSCLVLWLTGRGITLAHTDAQGLSYINTFDYVRPNDSSTFLGEVMYYLSLVWQSLNLSEECRLTIAGEEEEGTAHYAEQAALIDTIKTELKGRIANIQD